MQRSVKREARGEQVTKSSATSWTHLGAGHQDAVTVAQLAAAAQRHVPRHVEQAVAEDDRPRVSRDSHPLSGALLWLPLILEQVTELLPVEDFNRCDTRLASLLHAVVSQTG